MKYVAMWNMPGCLPEMEPAVFDTFEEAREFIAEELDAAAEFDAIASDFLQDVFPAACPKALTPLLEAEAALVRAAVQPFVTSPQPDGHVYSVEGVEYLPTDGDRMDDEYRKARDG